MITDPTIRDQAYQYFLQEAPELLETIEQELFAINDESLELKERPLRVNKLMRATHTLKGGAANVGLETIKTVAHSLEDVFKALYNPELVIDNETKKLLYESFECLREPLVAEFSKISIDHGIVLDRAATVFALLQDKFGDYLTDQDAFPSSEELGLDVVESFFREVVPDRIQELSTALANDDTNEVSEVLRSQAEIFLGLAESLNLPGFGEIAQLIITALDSLPDQAIIIAKNAIADLHKAQKQVLEGDRTRGGEPSATLYQLASGVIPHENEIVSSLEQESSIGESDFTETANSSFAEIDNLEVTQITLIEQSQELVQAAGIFLNSEKGLEESEDLFISNEEAEANTFIFGSEEETEDHMASIVSAEPFGDSTTIFSSAKENDNSEDLVHQIWGEEPAEITELHSDNPSNESNDYNTVNIPVESGELVHEIWGQESQTESPSGSLVPSPAKSQLKAPNPEIAAKEITATKFTTSSKPQNAKNAATQTVRVNLDSLERLNDLIGELLINQNHNVVQDEQVYGSVQQLLERVQQNEEIINQIIDLVDEICLSPQQQKILQELPEKLQQISTQSGKKSEFSLVSRSSSGLSQQTELTRLLQLATESNVELVKIAEQIKNSNKQAHRNIQKQQRMLLNMRDELIETRMSPIGRVFNRFPRLLNQLSTTYAKQVELKITGNHILIDKTIEEKLYDPLLHLIRNAFDHGIESAEERRQSGKLETGKIELRAYYQGGQTFIEVKDDGKGLNLEKIKQRGIELNLINPQQANSLSASKILELLFESGFSTAAKVSDLSGRGVGLDVVRAQVEDMNGSLQIESTPQKGTTFALQVPLSLTIAKLMLIEAGNMTYALLIDAIERIVVPTSNQIKIFENQKVLHWRTEHDDQMIPVRKLSNLMEYSRIIYKVEPFSNNNLNNPILLLRRSNGLVGLEVDKVLGEQELVIRPLGSAIACPNFIYGCSVLKNSRLTLVIDGTALLQQNLFKTTPHQTLQPYLPAATPEALPSSQNGDRQLLPASPIVARTLLVVDDSSSLRHSISSSVQKISDQVLQAENGLKALEKLYQTKEVDLVVCDLEMPFMNGFQFLKAVRQNNNCKDIPIIILTSRDSDKHRSLALELGATAYLTKPYDEQQLLSTITSIINKK